MYSVETLIDGFPGKTASHGAFGWSSVWLFRSSDHTVIVDAGPHAFAPVIIEELANRGLETGDVTDVLLTHAHWDHSANFTIFENARTWIGADELDWAAQQKPGTHFLSDLHTKELVRRSHSTDDAPSVERVNGELELLPGVRSFTVPGHTPGHLAFMIDGGEFPVIVAGDAVKNIRELSTREPDSTMDEVASRLSIDKLHSLMRESGAILVPGHDVPLIARGSAIERMRPQSAQITFFDSSDGDGVDRTISALSPPSP